jgi:hypothetical protein
LQLLECLVLAGQLLLLLLLLLLRRSERASCRAAVKKQQWADWYQVQQQQALLLKRCLGWPQGPHRRTAAAAGKASSICIFVGDQHAAFVWKSIKA